MNRVVITRWRLFVCFSSVLILFGAPFLGASSGFSLTNTSGDIFWTLRVPRVLLGFMVGAALSIGGMSFQALFRNALATPYTLGIASGASFGATTAIRFGSAYTVWGSSVVSLAALVGALTSMVVVYTISARTRRVSSSTLLLAGVVMSFFFSSLMLFVQYLSDFGDSFRVVRWLMGGLETIGYAGVVSILPFVLPGAVAVFLLSRELDLISVSEEIAVGHGVSIEKLRRTLFFAVSVLVAGVVAVAGPIGFVGIIVPHCCRRTFGAGHRLLAPACLYFGGVFLVACDIFARVAIAPAELPVGVITALLGGPFFLWILLRSDDTGSTKL